MFIALKCRSICLLVTKATKLAQTHSTGYWNASAERGALQLSPLPQVLRALDTETNRPVNLIQLIQIWVVITLFRLITIHMWFN